MKKKIPGGFVDLPGFAANARRHFTGDVAQALAEKPDPHCRIGRVRLKGSDHWFICPDPLPKGIENVRCTMTVGALRIHDGVVAVADEGGGP